MTRQAKLCGWLIECHGCACLPSVFSQVLFSYQWAVKSPRRSRSEIELRVSDKPLFLQTSDTDGDIQQAFG